MRWRILLKLIWRRSEFGYWIILFLSFTRPGRNWMSMETKWTSGCATSENDNFQTYISHTVIYGPKTSYRDFTVIHFFTALISVQGDCSSVVSQSSRIYLHPAHQSTWQIEVQQVARGGQPAFKFFIMAIQPSFNRMKVCRMSWRGKCDHQIIIMPVASWLMKSARQSPLQTTFYIIDLLSVE